MFNYSKTEAKDKIYEEMTIFGEDNTGRVLVSSYGSRPRKLRVRRTKIPDLNLAITADGEEEEQQEEIKGEPQDADYSLDFPLPQLSDELEISILARFPHSLYWKILSLNKKFSSFVKSRDIFEIRKQIRFTEPSVFMLSAGDTRWRAFDREFKSCRKLPELPSDDCFASADRESLCAGTHLIISGKEIESTVVWRYDLETNEWQKGPSMINPRCLFASATCGACAFVAGGIRMETGNGEEILSTAEKYDAENKKWVLLPRMHKRRSFCSGCYLDNEFYVIGGKNEYNEHLTCGERYDEGRNEWELIPDMLKDAPYSTHQSPPLIAVVKNDLYWLEPLSNELRVYVKSENSWKKLGLVPVSAEPSEGWGVAFKSLGDELLVIGQSSSSQTMAVYTCCPCPNPDYLQWKQVQCCCRYPPSHFIRNCAVMVA